MGALGCCSRFAKYILLFFNFLFVVVGSALLATGIWALWDTEFGNVIKAATVSSVASDDLVQASAVTLIIVGALVFLIAFFGCFGACNENSCCLTIYAVIVGFLFGVQLLAGIMGAVFKDQLLDVLGESMNTTVHDLYGQEGYTEGSQSWDYMQRLFKCCGAIEGPSEWKSSQWYSHQVPVNGSEPNPVPLTCCVLTNDLKFEEDPQPLNTTLCYEAATSGSLSNPQDYIHTQACKPRLEDWIKSNTSLIIGVAFGLAFVELFGILFACCIIKGVRSQYEYV